MVDFPEPGILIGSLPAYIAGIFILIGTNYTPSKDDDYDFYGKRPKGIPHGEKWAVTSSKISKAGIVFGLIGVIFNVILIL